MFATMPRDIHCISDLVYSVVRLSGLHFYVHMSQLTKAVNFLQRFSSFTCYLPNIFEQVLTKLDHINSIPALRVCPLGEHTMPEISSVVCG